MVLGALNRAFVRWNACGLTMFNFNGCIQTIGKRGELAHGKLLVNDITLSTWSTESMRGQLIRGKFILYVNALKPTVMRGQPVNRKLTLYDNEFK